MPAMTTAAFPVTPLQAKQLRELATDAVRYCLVLEGELLRAAVLLSAAAARPTYPIVVKPHCQINPDTQH